MADWRPIATGGTADRFRSVVEEIDRALSTAPSAAFTPDLKMVKPPPGVSPISVHPHLALWPVHFEQATGCDSQLDVKALLEELLSQGPLASQTGLFGDGQLAAGWVYAHLVDYDEENDPLCELESLIAASARASPWEHRYELIDGLISAALLLRERCGSPTARASIEHIQERLIELSGRADEGRFWHTRAAHGPPGFREEEPDGRIDLGYAHGMLGILSYLSDLVADGHGNDTTRSLLADGLRFVLGQQIDGPLRFPAWLPTCGEPRASRLGWCYGDLGVAILLIKAGNSMENHHWVSLGTDIARRLVGVSIPQSRVVEGGLCHGAASAAHLFNRLYQATGEPELRDRALFWFEHLLSFRDPDDPVMAGFQTFRKNFDTDEMVRVLDGTLLSGILGMGLSLLAALSDEEPSWDRILGIAIPRCASGKPMT